MMFGSASCRMSVIVAFINQPLPFIQIVGFALAAGVLDSAFFVRMSLVPATMFLLGRATWWLPKWMDKVMRTKKASKSTPAARAKPKI